MADVFLSIPIGQIVPSPTNPRKRFDEGKLAELAASIKSQGIVQPVVVRPSGDASLYELVAGERRYRAALLASLDEIPAMVRELSDADVLEIQVLENAQREDVHPLEECHGFKRILDSGMYGAGLPAIEQLAGKLGKSTSYVYQRLKLADLTEEAQKEFLDGFITAGHAVMIARLQPADQVRVLGALLDGREWDGQAYVTPRESGNVSGVRTMAKWISNNVTRKLSSAPWKFKDADLLPAAGSCSACAKRTGAEGKLFDDEDKSDRCLDGGCFEAKRRAFVAQRLDEAKAANPEADLVQVTMGGRDVPGLKRVDRWDMEKEAREGYVPVVIAAADDEDLVGTVRYVSPRTTEAARTQDAPDPEQRKKRLEELRLQRVENLTRQRVYETCLVAIEQGAGEGMLGGTMAQIVLLKALDTDPPTIWTGSKYMGPKANKLLEQYVPPMLVNETLRKGIATNLPDPGSIEIAKLALGMCVRDEIHYHGNQTPAGWALFAFAEALHVDVKGIREISDFDCLSKKNQKARLDDLRGKARPDKDLIARLEARLGGKAEEVAA